MLRPGTLEPLIQKMTRQALKSGALQPLAVQSFELPGAYPALVRQLPATRVRRGTSDRSSARNPFLPYDPALLVAELSPTHVALLNKYPVVEQHLLIVTREFRSQTATLEAEDWDSLWTCLDQFDSLGFYNSGQSAGASQPHRHWQLVTPARVAGGRPLLLDDWLRQVERPDALMTLDKRIPFSHALAGFDAAWSRERRTAHSYALYRQMLAKLSLNTKEGDPKPYNLLVRPQGMLMVPRRSETFAGISLNAIAFTGGLLVRSSTQLTILRKTGLAAAWQAVTPPRAGSLDDQTARTP